MPGLEGSHSWRLASNNWVLYLPVHQWCASIRIKLMKITRTNDHRIARNFFNETFPLRFRDVKVEAINCHCTRQQTENHRSMQSCIHVYTFMYTYVCVIATWYFDHTLNIRSEEGWPYLCEVTWEFVELVLRLPQSNRQAVSPARRGRVEASPYVSWLGWYLLLRLAVSWSKLTRCRAVGAGVRLSFRSAESIGWWGRSVAGALATSTLAWTSPMAR